jgi:hypothetical protein
MLPVALDVQPEQFSEFRHAAVHELMRLNDACEQEFHINSCPHWDYDLERGNLTFSESGVPKVRASIQVIGTTSFSGGTWLWGWANESLPPNVTKAVAKVREFRQAGNIAELTEGVLPDDQYLGRGYDSSRRETSGSKGSLSVSRREWLIRSWRIPWMAGSKKTRKSAKWSKLTLHGRINSLRSLNWLGVENRARQ